MSWKLKGNIKHSITWKRQKRSNNFCSIGFVAWITLQESFLCFHWIYIRYMLDVMLYVNNKLRKLYCSSTTNIKHKIHRKYNTNSTIFTSRKVFFSFGCIKNVKKLFSQHYVLSALSIECSRQCFKSSIQMEGHNNASENIK